MRSKHETVLFFFNSYCEHVWSNLTFLVVLHVVLWVAPGLSVIRKRSPVYSTYLCLTSHLGLIFLPSEFVRIQPKGLGEGKFNGLLSLFLPFVSWLPLVYSGGGVREDLSLSTYREELKVFSLTWD